MHHYLMLISLLLVVQVLAVCLNFTLAAWIIYATLPIAIVGLVALYIAIWCRWKTGIYIFIFISTCLAVIILTATCRFAAASAPGFRWADVCSGRDMHLCVSFLSSPRTSFISTHSTLHGTVFNFWSRYAVLSVLAVAFSSAYRAVCAVHFLECVCGAHGMPNAGRPRSLCAGTGM